MFQRLHITASLVAGIVAASMALSACSSSSSSSSGSDETSGSTAGVEHAKAEVAKYTDPAEFVVEALASTPPPGKLVAEVNCNFPVCNPGAMRAPVEVLGWELQSIEYDIVKGPQDFVRAFRQALDLKPDYLAVNMAYPEDIVDEELDRAAAEGIPVVDLGGRSADKVAILVQGAGVFEKAGAIAADVALADAGKPVKVVVPVDTSISLLVSGGEGVQDELKQQSPDSSAELLELSLSQPAATNVSSIVNYLKRNPDTQYIVFPGSAFYAGVRQGLQAAGLVDKVKLILMFPFPSDIKAIQDGEFIATVAGEATHHWRQVDAMARLSVGEEITDKEPISAFRIIEPEGATLEQFDPPNFQDVYKAAWGL